MFEDENERDEPLTHAREVIANNANREEMFMGISEGAPMETRPKKKPEPETVDVTQGSQAEDKQPQNAELFMQGPEF